MAFTPDYLPIIDAARGLPGVWFAGGFCGHGMPFAPIVGRLLAEAATTGVAPAPLAPFRLTRPTLIPTPNPTSQPPTPDPWPPTPDPRPLTPGPQ